MKTMLVSPELSDRNSQTLQDLFGSENIFAYNSPIKALDNLDEISPDIILWNIVSFPRHWKVFVPFYLTDSTNTAQLILFTDGQPDEKEAKKAEALGVAGIIHTGLDSSEARDFISQCLHSAPASAPGTPPAPGTNSAGTAQPQPAGAGYYEPLAKDKPFLTMTHPENLRIIRGRVLSLRSDTILLKPLQQGLTITTGMAFKKCHLNIRKYHLTVDVVLQYEGDNYRLFIQGDKSRYQKLFSKLVG